MLLILIMQQSKPWIIRLLAVSCVSLAAKMKETEFSIADLQVKSHFQSYFILVSTSDETYLYFLI